MRVRDCFPVFGSSVDISPISVLVTDEDGNVTPENSWLEIRSDRSRLLFISARMLAGQFENRGTFGDLLDDDLVFAAADLVLQMHFRLSEALAIGAAIDRTLNASARPGLRVVLHNGHAGFTMPDPPVERMPASDLLCVRTRIGDVAVIPSDPSGLCADVVLSRGRSRRALVLRGEFEEESLRIRRIMRDQLEAFREAVERLWEPFMDAFGVLEREDGICYIHDYGYVIVSRDLSLSRFLDATMTVPAEPEETVYERISPESQRRTVA